MTHLIEIPFLKVFFKKKKVKNEPNKKFRYSNLGYIFLGQLVEKASGQRFEQYVNEHIIGKLKVGKSQLAFSPKDFSNHAKGYHKRSSLSFLLLGLFLDKSTFMDMKEGKWKSFKPYYVNGAPYGGLIGTGKAFVNYLQDLLNPQSILISEESKKLLFTENFTTKNKATGMCLSWFKGQLNGVTYYTHAGGGGGYYCELRLYPALGTGSVIMFNRTGMSDKRFLDNVDKFFINTEEN